MQNTPIVANWASVFYLALTEWHTDEHTETNANRHRDTSIHTLLLVSSKFLTKFTVEYSAHSAQVASPKSMFWNKRVSRSFISKWLGLIHSTHPTFRRIEMLTPFRPYTNEFPYTTSTFALQIAISITWDIFLQSLPETPIKRRCVRLDSLADFQIKWNKL